MEVEVALALSSGISAVLIACIAATIAIFSCKYARKTQSQTDEEATQVDVVHEQSGFSCFGIKWNSKKDNTFIKNGSAKNLYETETSYETKENQTAQILAGGTGVLNVVGKGMEIGERVYGIKNKVHFKKEKHEEDENKELKVDDYSSKDNEVMSSQTDNAVVVTHPITPRIVPPVLAEFLECHGPKNQGLGGEKFTAMLAQPPTATTPRQKAPPPLSDQAKKTVEPIVNKWWGMKNKKATEETELEVQENSNSDNKIYTSKNNLKTLQPVVREKPSLETLQEDLSSDADSAGFSTIIIFEENKEVTVTGFINDLEPSETI